MSYYPSNYDPSGSYHWEYSDSKRYYHPGYQQYYPYDDNVLPLQQYLSSYTPYKDRRTLVRELRIAAMRASVVPRRPEREAPRDQHYYHGQQPMRYQAAAPPPPAEAEAPMNQSPVPMTQLDSYEQKLEKPYHLSYDRNKVVPHFMYESKDMDNYSPVVAAGTNIHHHHHHYYYQLPNGDHAANTVKTKIQEHLSTPAKTPTKAPPSALPLKTPSTSEQARNAPKEEMEPSGQYVAARRHSRTASFVFQEVEKEQEKHDQLLAQPSPTKDEDDEDSVVPDNTHQEFVFLAPDAEDDKDEKQEEPLNEQQDHEEEEAEAEIPSTKETRASNLMKMLEEADAAAMEVENEEKEASVDNSMSLIAFGDRLNQARKLKSSRVVGSTRLPQYATEQEENPSRPPPVVQPIQHQTRSFRSKSDGDKASTLQLINKEGYLMKSPSYHKSKYGMGPWKTRYFKLSGRLLVYTKDEASQIPKGLIDLSEIEIETNPKHIGQAPTPHCIMLYDRDESKNRRVFKLCANSHNDILSWYHALITNAFILTQTPEAKRIKPIAPSKKKSFRNIVGADEEESPKKLFPYKSLPPVDRTPLTAAQKREREERRKRRNLPKPPPIKSQNFYPLYRPEPTHYDILGIKSDANSSTIKKAYRSLARDFHPDRNPDADPKEFARVAQAYEIIIDPTNRERYDLGERVKAVLRRGFDATVYIPTAMQYDETLKRSFPSTLSGQNVTIFCDGNLNCLFYQPISSNLEEPTPLQPTLETCFELRFVQRVLYGCDDMIMTAAFDRCPVEKETRLVLSGSKLKHDVYIELDSPEACRQMVEGFRIIRCERSMLFTQVLEKWLAEGGN